MWVAPMSCEKCGLSGKSIGWVAALQSVSKTAIYRAWGSVGSCGPGAGDGGEGGGGKAVRKCENGDHEP